MKKGVLIASENGATIVYPHQIFRESPALSRNRTVCLVEDPWFFSRLHFHAQKLVLHRATMRHYRDYLVGEGFRVEYYETGETGTSAALFQKLAGQGVREIHLCDPLESGLYRLIEQECNRLGIRQVIYESPMFLCTRDYLTGFYRNGRRFYLTEFYIEQRKRHGILLEPDGKPVGKRWTFDTLNREPLPEDQPVPPVWHPGADAYVTEAVAYVRRNFPAAYGDPEGFAYPVTFQDAERWLADFLVHRLELFGRYEDAIHRVEPVLFHSVLSPLLNIGLLIPREVVDAALLHAEHREIPLPSLEGFIRQMIGWREFIRAVYLLAGERERTTNALNCVHPVPPCFWTASTRIEPVDTVIRRVLATGYSHHIERLMILGNLMLLSGFHPDEVYRWFSELFIDAYDWVMVPNVYGMSQFADGGLMSSKPYISGSRYVLRMSNYPEGPWCDLWDALYWRFLYVNREFFAHNPRMAPQVSHISRMAPEERDKILRRAEEYLTSIGACAGVPVPTDREHKQPAKRRRS